MTSARVLNDRVKLLNLYTYMCVRVCVEARGKVSSLLGLLILELLGVWTT
jgi:hypothetical protein